MNTREKILEERLREALVFISQLIGLARRVVKTNGEIHAVHELDKLVNPKNKVLSMSRSYLD